MIRRCLTLLALLLALPVAARAQDVQGNWLLATVSPVSEFTVAIVKAESDSKATIASYPPAPVNPPPNYVKPSYTVTDFKVANGTLKLAFSNGMTFTGTSSDGKTFMGSYGTDQFVQRAKLTRTDKNKLESADMSKRVTPPEAYSKATQITQRPSLLNFQASRETDADKKKALQDQAKEAAKELDKVPGLYKEVIEKHPNTLAAAEAATYLITNGKRLQLTPEQATKYYAIIAEQAKPYGSYATQVMLANVNNLVKQPGLESVALQILEPYYKANQKELANSGTNNQWTFYSAYKTALTANKKTDALAEVDSVLTKLDSKMDAEYHATVPPFKPAKFTGRKEADANQVAVLELFTGAQCPPCVAADVAFDALEKAYAHKDLVLIQYHMHIPGPDPMTSPASIARWDYYRKLFPEAIRGTPSTLFNGKPAAGGGGGMANAQSKYDQFAKVINPILEKNTPVRVTGTANRNGDKLDIKVEVYGAESEDPLKLRLLLVEDTVKYVGSNRLRFHHQVVRAMPGGADGVVVKSKDFKHSVTADVKEIQASLNKYLDEFAATRPFPTPNRPLDLKNLKVIAIVQNDKTANILQAVQLDVSEKVAAK